MKARVNEGDENKIANVVESSFNDVSIIIALIYSLLLICKMG